MRRHALGASGDKGVEGKWMDGWMPYVNWLWVMMLLNWLVNAEKDGGNTRCGPHRVVDLLLASSVGGETKRARVAYLWDPRTSLDTETTRLGDVERARDGEW